MKFAIRTLQEHDFEALEPLYDHRKSIKELKWVFKNPDSPQTYNGFVAVDENDLLFGVIGYMRSEYYLNGTTIDCITPFNWKLSTQYKGMAGVVLFKKVLALSDMIISVGGSDVAKTLYPLFKFKSLANNAIYYKVVHPINYLKSLKTKGPMQRMKLLGYLLPSYFKRLSATKMVNDLEFLDYNDQIFEEPKNKTGFYKRITKNYLDWLLECPLVESMAFNIKYNNDFIGTCILYIDSVENVKRGRIVYVPHIDQDQKLANTVIRQCVELLIDENCCLITCLSRTIMNQTALKNNGFIKIDGHSTLLNIKDSKNLLTEEHINNWHFQYAEGDDAYRGI